jgi:polyhydroxybutyrate depolymerase
LWVALLLLCSLALACGGRVQARAAAGEHPATDQAITAVTGCGIPATRGLTLASIRSGGSERTFRLYLPAGYDPSRPTPLVMNFHGFGGNGFLQERYAHMQEEAEKSGFIAVAPDGTQEPPRWHIYARLEDRYGEDFDFVRDLVDHLGAQLCLDRNRIYAAGISNGGGMSSLLGCELNDVIAAIAPVAGSPFPGPACRGKQPMPVVAFHGTDDPLVPFEGGRSGRFGLAGRGVRDNMRSWAEHNGCNLALKSERIAGDVLLETYTGCKDGADVQLYVVEGGGHTWPGAHPEIRDSATTQSIDATALMWRFFAAHAKR